jgi:hypothetical protein
MQSNYLVLGGHRVARLRRHDSLEWVDDWDLFQVSGHREVRLRSIDQVFW